jgi:hypothetical protein
VRSDVNEKHQNNCETDIEEYSEQRLRRMPDILPIRLQDLLHRGKPTMRKHKAQINPRIKTATPLFFLGGGKSSFIPHSCHIAQNEIALENYTSKDRKEALFALFIIE